MAELVEITRCKDCQYWQKYQNTAGAGYCMCRELSFEYGNERKFNPVTMPDFYCGYGTPKERGEEK